MITSTTWQQVHEQVTYTDPKNLAWRPTHIKIGAEVCSLKWIEDDRDLDLVVVCTAWGRTFTGHARRNPRKALLRLTRAIAAHAARMVHEAEDAADVARRRLAIVDDVIYELKCDTPFGPNYFPTNPTGGAS